MKAGRLRGTLVRTFLARGLAVSGSLLLIVVAGRLYGPAGVGVLALAQSLILGVGTLARYGMGGTLMRYVGREPGDPNNRIYLRRALLTALLASVLGGGLLWAFREPLEDLFQAPGAGFGTRRCRPGYAGVHSGVCFIRLFQGAASTGRRVPAGERRYRSWRGAVLVFAARAASRG